MINLSSRQVDLIKKLINYNKITVKDFAETYNVSTRTIYREIDNINMVMKKYSLKIINSTDGLALKGDTEQIMNFRLMLPSLTYIAKDKDREILIIAELLQYKEPLKMQYFANKYDISVTTVSNLFKSIKQYLNEKNINLISKPGVGVYIEGSEKNIRQVLMDLLYRNYNVDKLVTSMQDDYDSPNFEDVKEVNDLNDELFNLIDYKTISVTARALNNFKKTMNYPIYDKIYVELCVHIALAIKRLENHQEIRLDNFTLGKLKKRKEYKFAKIITDYIEKETGIKIPEDEIGYITLHLGGLKDDKSVLNIQKEKVISAADKIIKEVSMLSNLNFEKDLILKNDLRAHMVYSLNLLESGHKIRNPMLSEIKTQYKNVYDKCKEALDILGKNLGMEISDDEIGYICIHFAAAIERMKETKKKYNILIVCPNGIGTSRMLMTRLNNIQEFNVVDVSSVLNIDKMLKSHHIDTIISTIPLKRNDIRVIVVNPLFTNDDLKKVEDELKIKLTINSSSENDFKENNLKNIDYISEYTMEINIIFKNTLFSEITVSKVSDIIQQLLNEPLKNNQINKIQSNNIKKSLKSREKLGTIVLPNKKFVIYHCVEKSINEAIFTIGKFKKPVEMNNLLNKKEKVCTAFLMAAPENNKKALEVIGDISTSLIREPDFINNLNKCTNLTDCKKIIKKMLLKNLYIQIKRNIN